MNVTTHFQMLARYNRIANERLFAKCAQLDDGEYPKKRAGSFGSIHGLLNHILLGDRRWMGLFESGERVTPPLSAASASKQARERFPGCRQKGGVGHFNRHHAIYREQYFAIQESRVLPVSAANIRGLARAFSSLSHPGSTGAPAPTRNATTS